MFDNIHTANTRYSEFTDTKKYIKLFLGQVSRKRQIKYSVTFCRVLHSFLLNGGIFVHVLSSQEGCSGTGGRERREER